MSAIKRYPGSDDHSLWNEALWGIALIGSVLVSLVVLVTAFGH
jgi:hypothetical protein